MDENKDLELNEANEFDDFDNIIVLNDEDANEVEFEHLDDISVVREKLINKINNDENFTRMVYKLIK